MGPMGSQRVAQYELGRVPEASHVWGCWQHPVSIFGATLLPRPLRLHCWVTSMQSIRRGVREQVWQVEYLPSLGYVVVVYGKTMSPEASHAWTGTGHLRKAPVREVCNDLSVSPAGAGVPF